MIEDRIERFRNIFQGLDRAHGVTIVGESNGNGQNGNGSNGNGNGGNGNGSSGGNGNNTGGGNGS